MDSVTEDCCSSEHSASPTGTDMFMFITVSVIGYWLWDSLRDLPIIISRSCVSVREQPRAHCSINTEFFSSSRQNHAHAFTDPPVKPCVQTEPTQNNETPLSKELYSLLPLKQSILESAIRADRSHASLEFYRQCVGGFKRDLRTLETVCVKWTNSAILQGDIWNCEFGQEWHSLVVDSYERGYIIYIHCIHTSYVWKLMSC